MATRDCVAPVVRIEAGARPLQVPTPRADFAIGLLVLDGLLMRRVGLDGRYGAELLGAGDLLRPWRGDDLGTTPAVAGEWRLLRPCRIAVLEAGFALRLGHYPEVTAALFDRTVRRSRRLAVNMAIVHQPRVEVRLRILLWMLAGRWGRRVPEGLRWSSRVPGVSEATRAGCGRLRDAREGRSSGELAQGPAGAGGAGTGAWRGNRRGTVRGGGDPAGPGSRRLIPASS
ncbi:MAG: hypothetical protein JSS68_13765 [Actinobacteria bacterium]|nr:hypothetical protein [Actinomycetota bacterium]